MIRLEEIPENEKCKDCEGTGGEFYVLACECCSEWRDCQECNGTGRKK